VPRNEFRTLDLPMADELGRRGGIRPRVRPQECASYDIAGVVPKLVFSPRTVAEASKMVAMLAQEGATIIIRGSGTKQSRPPAPPDVEVVLDSTRCRGIVDYVPADLTVRVAAGTRFAELQETLRANHQFFPVDPPFAAECTIGGILASRTSGALRQYYASPRDSVLGMRVCLSDGSVAFTGAKVVKSVAGYDIAKLFVGSFGTLGFIGEVVLKVAPLPAEQRAIYALFPRLSEACAAAAEIITTGLFPLATVALDAGAHGRVRALDAPTDRSWALIARFGGSVAGLRAMTDGAAELSASHGSRWVEVLDHDRTLFAWSDIAELAGGERYPATQFLTGKVACLPSEVPDVCALASKHFSAAELTAHPASGVVFIHADVAQQPELLGSLQSLWSECQTRAWSLEWLAAPLRLAATLRQPVPDTAPLLLMRRVKAALDPTGTFDPGRFLGGI
jgi:glycolate oxidase FAD binding subunit